MSLAMFIPPFSPPPNPPPNSPPNQSPSPPPNQPPNPPSDPCVILQVGERRFTTLASTLSDGSSFFASLLDGRWENSRSDDGSYFVDADPDLFAHILRYLRRGVLPIAFDRSHGFDLAFYRALQEEAMYFGVEPLHKWIKEEGYLRAVRIEYSVEKVKGQDINVSGYDAAVDGNTERSYYPSWGTEKIYQCPRGILVHQGNPNACGRACEKAKGEDEDEFVEQEILRTLVITKRVILKRVD